MAEKWTYKIGKGSKVNNNIKLREGGRVGAKRCQMGCNEFGSTVTKERPGGVVNTWLRQSAATRSDVCAKCPRRGAMSLR